MIFVHSLILRPQAIGRRPQAARPGGQGRGLPPRRSASQQPVRKECVWHPHTRVLVARFRTAKAALRVALRLDERRAGHRGGRLPVRHMPHTHTYTRTRVFIYVCMCMCVCVSNTRTAWLPTPPRTCIPAPPPLRSCGAVSVQPVLFATTTTPGMHLSLLSSLLLALQLRRRVGAHRHLHPCGRRQPARAPRHLPPRLHRPTRPTSGRHAVGVWLAGAILTKTGI
jgi:hypothetical protein